jgi:hypothetical protein
MFSEFIARMCWSCRSDPGVPAFGLRLEAVEQGMACTARWDSFGVPRFVSAVALGSRSGLIGGISLDLKCCQRRLRLTNPSRGFRYALAVSNFRLRARLDFSIPSALPAGEELPPPLDTAPHLSAGGT